MKPLVVLLVAFLLSASIFKITSNDYKFALSARIAMSVMLVFTAVGHFKFDKGMILMIPDIIPYKKEIVFLTGLFEIAAAIGLLIPVTRVWTGYLLIAFFILILPANIFSAIKQVDYQNGTFNGPGLGYLWFRIPLQLLFIAWTFLSAIKF